MYDDKLDRSIFEMFGGDLSMPQEQTRKPLQAPPPAPRPAPAPPPDPAPQPPQRRFYMKKLRGTANYLENHSNEFFQTMARQHPSFQVVSTTAVSLPDSLCIYITYSLEE